MRRLQLPRPLAWFLLAAGVLATRLPFLGPGFGTDPDAWRVAEAARFIHRTGTYGGSRLPGHPVQEVVSSWLWPGGALALNLATALFSLLAVLCFVALCRQLRTPYPALSGLALAATPVVYIHSTDALDYVWALGLLLLSILLVRARRAVPAGIALGLAIGCRITFALFVPPLALLLPGRRKNASRAAPILRFLGSALLVGALSYLPVVLEYGWGFLRSYQLLYPSPLLILKQATLDVWGAVGLLGVAAGLGVLAARALTARRGRAAPNPERKLWTAVSLLVLLVTIASYVPLPHEAGYLLPAVPFTILLFGLWLPRRAHLLCCVSLLVSPWLFKLTQAPRPFTPAQTALAMPLEYGRWQLRWEPFRGPILYDHARRSSEMSYVLSMVGDSTAARERRVVVVHEWLPMIRVLAGGEQVGEARYVSSLSLDSLRFHLAQGTPVYFLTEAEWPNVLQHGFHLAEHGARPLPER
jgi:hypothetical protein